MSSREAFEAWVDSNFPFKKDRFDLFRGEYKSQFTEQLWQSWQAGREGLDARLKSAENNDIDARCNVAELQSKCAALAADNEKAMEAMRQADAAVKLAHEKFSALAAENAELKKAAEFATADDMWIEQADGMLDYRYVDWYVDVMKSAMKTPATNTFMAEMRASARNDFIGRIEWIIRNECNPDKTEAIINELQNFSDELKLETAQ